MGVALNKNLFAQLLYYMGWYLSYTIVHYQISKNNYPNKKKEVGKSNTYIYRFLTNKHDYKFTRINSQSKIRQKIKQESY